MTNRIRISAFFCMIWGMGTLWGCRRHEKLSEVSIPSHGSPEFCKRYPFFKICKKTNSAQYPNSEVPIDEEGTKKTSDPHRGAGMLGVLGRISARELHSVFGRNPRDGGLPSDEITSSKNKFPLGGLNLGDPTVKNSRDERVQLPGLEGQALRKHPVRIKLLHVKGSLGTDIVRKTVTNFRHVAQVRFCYISKGLSHNAKLKGRVAALLTISSTGHVSLVRIFTSTLNHNATQSCLKRTIKRWKFPKTKVGDTVVKIECLLNVDTYRLESNTSVVKETP